ncbi:isochorismatase family protein [Streptomyces iconiensis]|uniref:Isochorismatase family protein n=1 Tax=Streptomyces iconiensis TaxID=1384038 RepID=A0ABT7A6T9_9ACTN|nr:isochorismatase family protein [Streptomyces iconiensis]MDJ1137060.1 isochorismatase family protein [Streptomyces iconiensis]
MALPAIAPYPLPARDALPANRVPWKVDPSRAVLLVHDLQNHFLSAYQADRSPVPELLANVAALKKDAALLGVPVVYTAQPGGQTPDERGLQQDFWGPGLPADPHAEAIAAQVAPGAGDTVLTKWKYSAFVRSELEERMRALDRDQLVLTGVYAHIGVLMTACDAWMRDIQSFVVADAVADFSAEEHAMALRWAAGRCSVVTTTDTVFTADTLSTADTVTATDAVFASPEGK